MQKNEFEFTEEFFKQEPEEIKDMLKKHSFVKTNGYIVEKKYFIFKNNLAKFLLDQEKQTNQIKELSLDLKLLSIKEDDFYHFSKGVSVNKESMFWNEYYIDEFLHPLNDLNYIFSSFVKCFLYSFQEDEINYVSLNYENNFLLNEMINYFYERVKKEIPILESLYMDFEEYEEKKNPNKNQGVNLYGIEKSEIHLLKFIDPEKYNTLFLNWFFKDFKSINGFFIIFKNENNRFFIEKTKK